MRRKDREVTEPEQIREILEKGRVVHLGLTDGDMPYVVPLHYGYEWQDGRVTLYMHSALEGRKLDLIRANPKAFAEITAEWEPFTGGDNPCKYGAAFACVMGAGRASLVEDPAEKRHGLNVLLRTQTGREFDNIPEERVTNVAVIRMDVEELSAKRKPVAPSAAESARMEQRKLLEMDNRELFCVLTGDRGPIAQALLQNLVRKYRAENGKDADLKTIVQTIAGEEN